MVSIQSQVKASLSLPNNYNQSGYNCNIRKNGDYEELIENDKGAIERIRVIEDGFVHQVQEQAFHKTSFSKSHFEQVAIKNHIVINSIYFSCGRLAIIVKNDGLRSLETADIKEPIVFPNT